MHTVIQPPPALSSDLQGMLTLMANPDLAAKFKEHRDAWAKAAADNQKLVDQILQGQDAATAQAKAEEAQKAAEKALADAGEQAAQMVDDAQAQRAKTLASIAKAQKDLDSREDSVRAREIEIASRLKACQDEETRLNNLADGLRHQQDMLVAQQQDLARRLDAIKVAAGGI